MVIPFQGGQGWQHLKYRNIPQNRVQFDKETLKVEVQKSASPLFFGFSEIKMVTGFQVKGVRSPKLRLSDPQQQGNGDNDDFALRFGLVVSGTNRLTMMQRAFAPDWIVQIEKSLPKSIGVGGIEFFNVAESSVAFGKKRVNSATKNIYETNLVVPNEMGNFILHKKLAEALNVVGIFLSFDGDNSKSDFKIEISNLEITYQ